MKPLVGGLVFDAYDRRARLAPALLVAFPLAVGVLAWFPSGFPGLGVLLTLLGWCGATVLAANMGRDMGKKREAALYARWGGKPTLRRLRHRDAPNHALLERQHRQLAALVPGTSSPTRDEELADPFRADETYELWTGVLRQKTRDKGRFVLLFAENCSYGFRRNLWGMKPVGIATCVVGAAAGVVQIWQVGTKDGGGPLAAACLIFCGMLLVGWLFWFTAAWVRIPAEGYADQLLAAVEDLVPAELGQAPLGDGAAAKTRRP